MSNPEPEALPAVAEKPVIHALVRKRAQLAGEIEAAQTALQKMLATLDHLDFVIHVFDAGYSTDTIRSVPPLRRAFRGQSQPLLLDALRKAEGPVTVHDLASALMANRGIAEAKDVRRFFTRRVSASMFHLRRKGTVRSFRRGRYIVAWELIRAEA